MEKRTKPSKKEMEKRTIFDAFIGQLLMHFFD